MYGGFEFVIMNTALTLFKFRAHHGLQAHVSTAIDVYAFGVIAFELLLEVFAGDVNRDYARSLRDEPVVGRAKLTTIGCAAALSDAIVRCLSPDAAARPTAAALARFLAGDVVTGTLDAAAEAERAPRIGEVVTAAAAPLHQTLPQEGDSAPPIQSTPVAAPSLAVASPSPAGAAAASLPQPAPHKIGKLVSVVVLRY
jgi:hypothetical protein